MTTERWERVRALYDSAATMPEPEAEDFLRAECADDTELYLEVRRMLDEHFRTESLETSIPGKPGRRAGTSLTPGSIVSGRYRVVRMVGHGGMGEVYEAEDLELKERVAIKTLLPEIAADGRMIARFKQEIRLSRKVAHPHVCRVFDLARHPAEGSSADAVFFLTMEFLEGETLRERLQRGGRMQIGEALPVVRQTAEALDAAHCAGVVHRDFKPSNVMLTDAGKMTRAVVTDFGLARRLTQDWETTVTITGPLMGTVDYMAPELFRGSDATVASDIYALGLVMYEMVAGRRAFEGKTPLDRVMKRLSEDPSTPAEHVPDLEPRWGTVILRCLERDPAQRFGSAIEVANALTGATLPAISSPAPMRPPGNRTKRLALAAVAVAAALAAIVFGIVELARHRPPATAVRWYEQGVRALRDGTSYTAMTALQRAVDFDPDFLLAHARLAEAATDLDYMDKARSEMLRASPPAFQSWFLSAEDKLRLEAVYFVLIREFEKAGAKYKELASRVAPEMRAAVLVDLGRAYESGGKFPEALASYSESIALDNQVAAGFLRRAVLEGRQQQNAKASADFDTAEQLYNAGGNAEGITEVFYQRAALLRRTGKLADARVPAESALNMARNSHDDYHQIRSLLMLSYLRYNSGDIESGQNQASEAIDLARRVGIEVLATSGLVDVGNALFNKGDYAAAEPYLREALSTARRFEAVRVEARAELTLGQLLVIQGRTEEGFKTSKQAIADFEKYGDKSNAARAAIPAARILRDQGDYDEAANLFRFQIQLAERVRDEGGIAFGVQGLGSALLLQENYVDALANFERGSQVSHAVGDRATEAYCYVSRADALRSLGRYSEATESLQHAEQLDQQLKGNEPLLASLTFSQAEMNLSLLQFEKSEQDVRRMTEAAKTGPLAASAKRLECLYRIGVGQTRRGLALCEEAVQSAKTFKNVPLLMNSELALAQAKLAYGASAGASADARTLAAYFRGKGQRESELRSLAIAVSASRDPDRSRFIGDAKACVAQLRQFLGPAYSTFMSRPDIRQAIQRAGLEN